MSRRHLSLAAAAVVLAVASLTAGCGSRADGGARTLTYWASNQGASLAADRATLQPELDAFQKQTGIKVNVEVVPWSDLLNRLLAAATSGKGPDVVNIGNTWSASMQATGAMLQFDDATLDAVGGRARFVPAALAASGATGQPPTAVPLYSLAYALYYNKAEFAAAGLTTPPATWEDLVADGKRLTHGDQWGLAVEGANPSENAHHAFTFSQQYGGSWFDATGRPTFDTPANVQAIKRYIDLMATDKIVNPADAEYAQNQSITDFAGGKAAMLLWQAAGSSLRSHNMSTDAYGVAPVPFLAHPPAAGRHIDSMVAGINIAVFKFTRNKDAALRFVRFMTSDQEQTTLNGTYGSLPSVTTAMSDAMFQHPEQKVLAQVLAASAAPLPQVSTESQFESLVGTDMKNLFADAASGHPITDAAIRAMLTQAQQQVH